MRAHYNLVHHDCLWIPVVAVVESLRGGVNSIKDGDPDRVVKRKYELFLAYYDFLKQHQVLPLGDEFSTIKQPKTPKGVRDRRIASIALAHKYTIATFDVDDFETLGVPSEYLANWGISQITDESS